jgi:hypothetical protein
MFVYVLHPVVSVYFGVIIYNGFTVLCDGINTPKHKTDIYDPNHITTTPSPLRTDGQTHAGRQ